MGTLTVAIETCQSLRKPDILAGKTLTANRNLDIRKPDILAGKTLTANRNLDSLYTPLTPSTGLLGLSY
jgi:hypothetical protein